MVLFLFESLQGSQKSVAPSQTWCLSKQLVDLLSRLIACRLAHVHPCCLGNSLTAASLAEQGYLNALSRGQPIDQEAISLALRRAFQLCDDEIVEVSKAEDNWKGGTTACIALTIDKV